MTAAPTMPDLCRVAADAVTRLCATLRDCALEVEERKGKIEARRRLARERSAAADAIESVYYQGTDQATQEFTKEIFDIAGGCRDGYVREAWALRLLQMAAVAPEPRDTEPSPAPTEACVCLGEMDTTCGGGSDG